MIDTKMRSKVLVTIVFLTMASTAGYGQGLLIEKAAKLFNNAFNPKSESALQFSNANYVPVVGDSYDFNMVNLFDPGMKEIEVSEGFEADILISFHANSVDVSFEDKLYTESWMTEQFINELDENVVVEPWMTEELYEELETVEVESWMTEPLVNEKGLETEGWMLKEFKSSVKENGITVEDWMTNPLYTSVKGSGEVEGWMTTLLR